MKRLVKGLSYSFHRNLGWKDRMIRTISALAALVAWTLGAITGVLGVMLGILALMVLGTAVISRCSITYMIQANTMSAGEKAELDTRGIKYEMTNDR